MTHCIMQQIIFTQLESLTLGNITERQLENKLIWHFITTHTLSISLLKLIVHVSSHLELPVNTLIQSWPMCTWPNTL
jgi:hypothetical protein